MRVTERLKSNERRGRVGEVLGLVLGLRKLYVRYSVITISVRDKRGERWPQEMVRKRESPSMRCRLCPVLRDRIPRTTGGQSDIDVPYVKRQAQTGQTLK